MKVQNPQNYTFPGSEKAMFKQLIKQMTPSLKLIKYIIPLNISLQLK